MRKLFLTSCLFLLATITAIAQDITGKWMTFDEKTGAQKSLVEIFKKNDLYYGKVTELFNASTKDPLCVNCKGDEKNKPIIGLVIIKDLKKDAKGNNKEFSGGRITDPQSGKQYKLNATLTSSDVLEVRGFVGISLIGRTQTWKRSK